MSRLMRRVFTRFLIAGLAVAGPAVRRRAGTTDLTSGTGAGACQQPAVPVGAGGVAIASEDRKQAFGNLLPTVSEFSQQ